jgi:hypothetical protein
MNGPGTRHKDGHSDDDARPQPLPVIEAKDHETRQRDRDLDQHDDPVACTVRPSSCAVT